MTLAALRRYADLLVEADVAELTEGGDAVDVLDHEAILAPVKIAVWQLLWKAVPDTRGRSFKGLKADSVPMW